MSKAELSRINNYTTNYSGSIFSDAIKPYLSGAARAVRWGAIASVFSRDKRRSVIRRAVAIYHA